MFRKRAEKKRRADRLGEDTQDAYGNTDFSAKAVEDFLKNLQSKEGRPPSRKEGRPSSRQGESLSTANHDEAPRDAVADAAALDNENDEASYNLYEVYRPAKFKEGKDHPDQIVETGSLANVSPPDIIREHSLKEPILKGCLSSAQLESIQYAMQKFEGPKLPNGETQGFLLGDGAGVGKGRQISGLIQECWSKGIKRILWVSVSSDLRWDAKRDLADVGVDLGDVELWPRLKEGKATTLPSGDLEETHGIRKGVVVCSKSALVLTTEW